MKMTQLCSSAPSTVYHILCSSLPTGDGMSTGATGVTPSPHRQSSSTVTAPLPPVVFTP